MTSEDHAKGHLNALRADLESYACVMMLMAGLAISTVGEEERTRKAALATGSEEVQESYAGL